MTIAAVLLDLDGTLADTAPDLARALNALRAQEGLPALPYGPIRERVSAGSYALLELAFGVTRADAACAGLRERLLDLYHRDIAQATRLFPGMDAVLAALEADGIAWGIVTNKPGWLTAPLLAALSLGERAACVVSGDTVARAKPDPAPLLEAARRAGIAPGRCLYVGDAQADIEAGRRAGMRTLAATWGYRLPGEDPAAWGADALVDAAPAILDWVARTVSG